MSPYEDVSICWWNWKRSDENGKSTLNHIWCKAAELQAAALLWTCPKQWCHSRCFPSASPAEPVTSLIEEWPELQDTWTCHLPYKSWDVNQLYPRTVPKANHNLTRENVANNVNFKLVVWNTREICYVTSWYCPLLKIFAILIYLSSIYWLLTEIQTGDMQRQDYTKQQGLQLKSNRWLMMHLNHCARRFP